MLAFTCLEGVFASLGDTRPGGRAVLAPITVVGLRGSVKTSYCPLVYLRFMLFMQLARSTLVDP